MHRFLSAVLVALAALMFANMASAAELTRVDIGRTSNGADLTALADAAVGGDTCDNDGNVVYRIQNDSGANAYTVTFDSTETRYGMAVSDLTVSVATSADRLVGPFPTSVFGRSLAVTYTGAAVATDLDVACYRLPAD